jgi:hypothetical protein
MTIPSARRLLVSVCVTGALACTSRPEPLKGDWQSEQTPLVLRVKDKLEAELCTPVLGVPLHLATATMEQDAFDRYHLRVSAIDSALNQDIPLSLLQALPRDQRAVVRAMSSSQYVLRFCAREDGGLTCDSLIGPDYAGWREITAEGGDNGSAGPLRPFTQLLGQFDGGCVPAGNCILGGTVPGIQILECMQGKGLPVSASSTSLCEAVSLFRDQALACLAERNLPEGFRPLAKQLEAFESACEAVEQIVSLDVSVDEATVCEPEGGPVPALQHLTSQLCTTIRTSLEKAEVNLDAGVPLVSGLASACGLRAQVNDFELSCCKALRGLAVDGGGVAADGGERPDAGQDGGEDVIPDGGQDAGCTQANCQTCCDGADGPCRTMTSFDSCRGQGGLCVQCDAMKADNCAVDGCRCGLLPACTGVCVAGQCG